MHNRSNARLFPMQRWGLLSQVRSAAWRTGRRIYSYARREGANDPVRNGEYWLLESLLTRSREPACLLDVGANRGDWSWHAVRMASQIQKPLLVYALEPTLSTFAVLAERFSGLSNVTAVRAAASDHCGESPLFVVSEPLAGRNSLLRVSPDAHQESVTLITIDAFLRSQSMERVMIVKSDTEGHDMSVLKGATASLREGRIQVWQFEYNHLWVTNRCFLRDVFDLIDGTGYRLGKLFANGIESYRSWHPELERFFECNYVLFADESLFPPKAIHPVRFNRHNTLEPDR
jgi:FkbM family methyltransferase